MQRAIFGGGCFWCLEAVFERLIGVHSVTSGYCGGGAESANYAAVCSGTTAHAEVVAIDFDPALIEFTVLLRIFFAIHDPTTPNRQGNDVGPQYRSVVFCQSPEQAAALEAEIAKVEREGWWPGPLVTQVCGAEPFFPAETYHHGYFRRNPEQGYCSFVVAPKVAKARAAFASYFRDVE